MLSIYTYSFIFILSLLLVPNNESYRYTLFSQIFIDIIFVFVVRGYLPIELFFIISMLTMYLPIKTAKNIKEKFFCLLFCILICLSYAGRTIFYGLFYNHYNLIITDSLIFILFYTARLKFEFLVLFSTCIDYKELNSFEKTLAIIYEYTVLVLYVSNIILLKK